MKQIITFLSLICLVSAVSAQKLDSIYFNLYTDSLKPGTYNYINVEGRYSNGNYLPLSDKELKFTSSGGTFSRNSLFIDTSFKQEKVTVRIESIADPTLRREITIYIKTTWDNEKLPTVNEILNRPASDTGTPSRKKKRNR